MIRPRFTVYGLARIFLDDLNVPGEYKAFTNFGNRQPCRSNDTAEMDGAKGRRKIRYTLFVRGRA